MRVSCREMKTISARHGQAERRKHMHAHLRAPGGVVSPVSPLQQLKTLQVILAHVSLQCLHPLSSPILQPWLQYMKMSRSAIWKPSGQPLFTLTVLSQAGSLLGWRSREYTRITILVGASPDDTLLHAALPRSPALQRTTEAWGTGGRGGV